MISDVSIVFCRATFGTLSLRKTSGKLVLNTIKKKHRRKSDEPKNPGLGSVDFRHIYLLIVIRFKKNMTKLYYVCVIKIIMMVSLVDFKIVLKNKTKKNKIYVI